MAWNVWTTFSLAPLLVQLCNISLVSPEEHEVEGHCAKMGGRGSGEEDGGGGVSGGMNI